MWKTVLVLLISGLTGTVAAAPSAEALLILTLSARVARPLGHAATATPGRALSEGSATPLSSDSVTLGRRAFRLTGRSQDLEAVAGGIFGQQIIVRFTAVVLPTGLCGITNYEAFGLAKPEPGRPFGAGSTLQVYHSGFAIEPGRQVSQTVWADSDAGTVVYTLSFTASKVFGAKPGVARPRSFEGW